MRVRVALACLTSVCAILTCLAVRPLPAAAADALGPSCGERLISSTVPPTVRIRILFAKNGAVERYQVIDGVEDPEVVNDAMLDLERVYGEAGANTPALRIVSFKKSNGAMLVPDKAIDSCGRTLTFN